MSIITLSRNVATVIEPTLKSVQNQTYCELEHVIVDGQSTDGTLEIIGAHRADVARLIIQPARGIADAFNTGIEHTTGELILFLNSGDTYIDEEAVSRVVDHYKEHGWSWSYGGVRFVTGSSSAAFEQPAREFSYERLLRSCFVAHSSVATCRHVFRDYGLFDTSYSSSMDYEFFLRIGKECPGAPLPFTVSQFVFGGTSSDNRRRYLEDRRARRAHAQIPRLRWAALEAQLAAEAYMLWLVKRIVPSSFQMTLRRWRQRVTAQY